MSRELGLLQKISLLEAGLSDDFFAISNVYGFLAGRGELNAPHLILMAQRFFMAFETAPPEARKAAPR